MSKEIISSLTKQQFLDLLKVNPGLVIIKLGASWCKPCKVIAPYVNTFFASSPSTVVCADLDVDDSLDLYAQFKKSRMVNGIPAILVYRKGNETIVPDDSITGSDLVQLDIFFRRCGKYLGEMPN